MTIKLINNLSTADIVINEYNLINFVNLDDCEKLEILKWRNDENIRRWMFDDKIIESASHLKFIDNLKNDAKNRYWRLIDNSGEKYGVISINRLDLNNMNSYLGIYKNPYSDKKGAGIILMKALFYAAFKKLALHTLKLEVAADNERAIKLYLKTGFREEGRLREFINKNGRRLDVVIMGITSREADYEGI
jgi:UDP-4-amino-4,6-dideoxy-N-acetyl-beta-L-altrosamine N-acetyltransferase